jgi:hypothetical protein
MVLIHMVLPKPAPSSVIVINSGRGAWVMARQLLLPRGDVRAGRMHAQCPETGDVMVLIHMVLPKPAPSSVVVINSGRGAWVMARQLLLPRGDVRAGRMHAQCPETGDVMVLIHVTLHKPAPPSVVVINSGRDAGLWPGNCYYRAVMFGLVEECMRNPARLRALVGLVQGLLTKCKTPSWS